MLLASLLQIVRLMIVGPEPGGGPEMLAAVPALVCASGLAEAPDQAAVVPPLIVGASIPTRPRCALSPAALGGADAASRHPEIWARGPPPWARA